MTKKYTSRSCSHGPSNMNLNQVYRLLSSGRYTNDRENEILQKVNIFN
jgi:hypothetical protein